MRFYRHLPVFAVASGLAGALLRALQLSTGFELTTGLYLSENLWGRLLLGWLLLSTALCALLARRGQHHACFEELFGDGGDLYKTVVAFSGLLLAAGGVVWLPIELQAMQAMPEDSGSWILALEVPFGVLCVVAGLCFVGLGRALSRGEITERHAALTMPPLFWAAFHLLVVYRQYCVSANLALFTVEIFASISCVMAFYHFSRMLYGSPTPRQFTFWAAMSTVLSLTDVFGYVLSLALGNLAVHWTIGAIVRGGCLLMGNAFLFIELWTITGKRLFPWRTKYAPELEDEEEPKPKAALKNGAKPEDSDAVENGAQAKNPAAPKDGESPEDSGAEDGEGPEASSAKVEEDGESPDDSEENREKPEDSTAEESGAESEDSTADGEPSEDADTEEAANENAELAEAFKIGKSGFFDAASTDAEPESDEEADAALADEADAESFAASESENEDEPEAYADFDSDDALQPSDESAVLGAYAERNAENILDYTELDIDLILAEYKDLKDDPEL